MASDKPQDLVGVASPFTGANLSCVSLVRSFGVILWEMVSADIPFSSMSDVQAAMNVSSGMRPRIPSHIAPLTKSLIEDCWRDNPAVRVLLALAHIPHWLPSLERSLTFGGEP